MGISKTGGTMATLIDRLTYRGDTAETEGMIDHTLFRAALDLYDSGDVDADFIKTQFGMTAAQASELDEILSTIPDPATQPVQRASWVNRAMARFLAGFQNGQGAGWPGYDDSPTIRTKFGLANV
jgi:hypothetical protein